MNYELIETLFTAGGAALAGVITSVLGYYQVKKKFQQEQQDGKNDLQRMLLENVTTQGYNLREFLTQELTSTHEKYKSVVNDLEVKVKAQQEEIEELKAERLKLKAALFKVHNLLVVNKLEDKIPEEIRAFMTLDL